MTVVVAKAVDARFPRRGDLFIADRERRLTMT